MHRVLVLAICGLLCAKIAADPLDDLRNDYVGQLQKKADETTSQLTSGYNTLDVTILYYDTASNTFINQAVGVVDGYVSDLNKTASDLTLQVISGNGDASTITCISNRYNTAVENINGKYATFQNDLAKASGNNNFDQTRTSLDLVNGGLPGLFETNKNNLMTCVVQDCFDNNLAYAVTQYDNINTNIKTIVSDITTQRAKFDSDALNALSTVRSKTEEDHANGVKQMNRCL